MAEQDVILEIRENRSGDGLVAHLATYGFYYDITDMAGSPWAMSSLLSMADDNVIDATGVADMEGEPDGWDDEYATIAVIGFHSEDGEQSERFATLMTDRMTSDGKRLFGISVR